MFPLFSDAFIPRWATVAVEHEFPKPVFRPCTVRDTPLLAHAGHVSACHHRLAVTVAADPLAPGRRLARGCQATGSASRRRRPQVRRPVLGDSQEVLPRNPPDPLLLRSATSMRRTTVVLNVFRSMPISLSTSASSDAWEWTYTARSRSQQLDNTLTRPLLPAMLAPTHQA